MVNEVLITVAPLNKLLDLLEIKALFCRKLSFSFFNSVFLPATGRQFSVRKSFNFLTVEEFRGAIVISKISGSHTSFTVTPRVGQCTGI